MHFRTDFKIKPFKEKITYNDRLLFLGSCFAENMGNYFHKLRFQTVSNPFGILYHPIAIERIIDSAFSSNYDLEEFSFQHNELWSNFEAHSSLSSSSKEELFINLKSSLKETAEAIKTSNFIFITLGTAWVYKYLAQDKIVANCHKLPQKFFEKKILEFFSVKTSLINIASKIKQANAEAKIVFTLSPVRHLKDGIIENQQSKSTLNLAIHEAIKNQKDISYFPSYELLLDDLRDYRFFEKDMIHPNKIALDYIWEKFSKAIFDVKTLEIIEKVKVINKRLDHRFFNPKSKASIDFKEKTDLLIKSLQQTCSSLEF